MQHELVQGLLTLKSHRVAAVATGSCLALYWAALTDMSWSGRGPALRNCVCINLPAAYLSEHTRSPLCE